MPGRPRFDPSKMSSPRPAKTGGLFAPIPSGPASGAAQDTSPPTPSSGEGASGSGEGRTDSPTTGGNPTVISVTQLAVLIERAIRDNVRTGLKVVGEISQFRDRTHWYFDLKDDGALVSCVMFASSARKAGFVPAIGQRVVVTGRVDFYAKQGRTTFMVDRIEPIGEGALELAFRKLCDELRAAGWFADERKRPLPFLPRRVAVVTSRTGAALQDVLDTVSRRCPAVEIATIDVRVQGEGAANEIVAALSAIGRHHAATNLDAVLITRGGGSREDLWAFNDRSLAEAILNCPIPVVAAIGHETDITIAELVADLRAATPTQAAMRMVPDADAVRRQLTAISTRLSGNLTRQVRHDRTRLSENTLGLRASVRASLSDARQRLDHVSARLERHRPVAVYARREADLRQMVARLHAAIAARTSPDHLNAFQDRLLVASQRAIERAHDLLRATERGLDLVGPPSVMKRGFSVTMGPDGRAIRSVHDVQPGQTITTRISDGGFSSVVTDDTGNPTAQPRFGPIPPPSPKPPKKRPPRHDHPDSQGLFGP